MHALTMIWGNSKILEIGSPPLSNSIEKITLRPKKEVIFIKTESKFMDLIKLQSMMDWAYF